MTAYRELNDEEKTLIQQRLELITDDLEHQHHMVRRSAFMLEEGLQMDYRQHRKEWEQRQKKAQDQIKYYQEMAKVLNEQLENGVAVQETTE